MLGPGPVGNVAESMNVLMSTLNVLTRRMVSTFVLVDGLIGLPFSRLLRKRIVFGCICSESRVKSQLGAFQFLGTPGRAWLFTVV